jgi:HD-GYP domain-containing protein (c-di-GMP phosphodiesterase class II)
MEWRDPYTAGHQRRVANISVAIATQLGWDSDRVQGIYMAGLVHDLGKVGIPAEILTKPSQLNAIEMSLVQTHAEAGYQILKDIPFPWPLAEAVRQHHERLDGSGYPRQLHGTEICPEARLLAIADMIEAMASHRPYRPSLGLKRARDQIIEDAGSKLDSEMVSAALMIMAENSKMESLLAN